MDALSVVFEVFGLAIKLYDSLSEADQQKVRDNFFQGRADLAADVLGLKDTIAQMEAHRAEAQAAKAAKDDAERKLAAESAAHQVTQEQLAQLQAQFADLKARNEALVASVDLAKPVT